MFAIELMLPELSSRTFLPVVLATGVATYVGRIAFGTGAAFLVPIQSSPELIEPISIGLLTTYAALGLLCGLAAMVFVRLLHWVEDRFDEMPYNPYVKNVIGMLGVGVLMYVLLLTTGAYHTEGVGYATIQSILDNQLTLFGLLLILFLAKLGATTVSLAAGASGGIFSPSLFLGATLGGAFGAGLDMMWPHLGLSPVPFAVIGMAAVVGGATGASMTAILMIFEMTGDYGITVGSIIAVACAVGIRRTLLLENIYTMKLARRGHRIPKERHMHMFLIRQAAEVMRPVVGWVQRDELIPTSPSPQRDATERPSYAVVVDGERIVGLVAVAGEDPRRAVSPVLAPVGIAREDTFLQSVMARMARRGHVATLVVKGTGVPRPENVVGVIARDSVADTIIADFAA
jgi:CIC family chloride channel protein